MKRTTASVLKNAAAVGAALGIQAGVNKALQTRAGSLTSGLSGTHGAYDWRLGKIWYSVKGDGPPVLLIHGIGAGASSYEWRRNFDELSNEFRVYAIDLLGFGLSDRPSMDHSGRFYVQLIDDFIRYVVKQPANVIASSHSAAYAIRLAFTRPERVKSLILVCPVGVGHGSASAGPLPSMGKAIHLPVVGESVYNGLVSTTNVARTLREDLFYDPGQVTDAMVDQYYRTAHQPGARHAVASFLQGDLNLPVDNEFKHLKQPILMVWGAESRYTPLVQARQFQEANGAAVLHVFQQTRQLPHDEQAGHFNRLVTSWLQPITADQALRIL